MRLRIVAWEKIAIVLTLTPVMLYAAYLTVYSMFVQEENIFLIIGICIMFAALTKIVAPIIVQIFKDGYTIT